MHGTPLLSAELKRFKFLAHRKSHILIIIICEFIKIVNCFKRLIAINVNKILPICINQPASLNDQAGRLVDDQMLPYSR